MNDANGSGDTPAPIPSARAMPQVDETGLTAAEVSERVAAGAVNKVKDSTSRSVKDIVRANVFTLFNGIILAAMVLVLATGSWKDAVFGFVIIINTGIGIVTELRAKRTLDRLSILVASDYLVRRDGRDVTVPQDGIVNDDLLWVRAGEQVPADAEIVRDWGLELDESMLTGESRTVRKHEGDDVYSGSTAVSGVALARVTAVGARSYAATLTAKAKVYKKTVSDLGKGINTILKFMTFLVVPLCVLLIISQIHTVGGWSVALVLCSERIRSDAAATLAWFREQGVRCRVISGDNPVTVGAIARKVRLAGEREPRIMDARTLPDDPAELGRVLEDVDVVGRVLPDQKKLIVDALHARGYTVAMTGDGVNDALALKEADLGIAMGNAAPATKAVAQVVLVDSKFSHLPDVVARGRQVMANMERVAGLFLVKTVYSALISLGVVLTAIPYPYLPRHITYIGALTIGMPAFILALAPNTRRYIPGFLKRVVHFALPGGVATALSVLACAWTLPRIMGWDVAGSPADLASLRATEAIVLFVMGVFVLARVARPLNGWRGILVAAFASAGVIGMFIPFVARFFALIVPTGAMLAPTLIALAGSAAIFAVCLFAVPWASRTLVERHFKRK